MKTAVASLFTAKVLTGVAVAAAATGGVALAAATHTLQGPLHGAAHSAVQAPALPGPASTAQLAPKPSTSPTHDAEAAPAKPGAAGSHATPSPSLTGLCTAYQAGVASNPGKALDNPAFAALITASGGKDKVAAYCTTRLAAAHPAGGRAATRTTGPRLPPASTRPVHRPLSRPGRRPRRQGLYHADTPASPHRDDGAAYPPGRPVVVRRSSRSCQRHSWLARLAGLAPFGSDRVPPGEQGHGQAP